MSTFLVLLAVAMAVTASFIPAPIAPFYALAGVIVAATAATVAFTTQWRTP